jgi:hypothetical protein
MGSVHPGGLLRGTREAKAARGACALLAAAALAPLPAAAQSTGYALIGAGIVDSTTLHPDADMDFGLIMPSAAGGNVVMTPSAAPTCTTTGGLIHSGACKAARFTGTSFYQAEMRVKRPNGDRIDLTGPGGATMRVQDFTFASTGTTVSLGANGANHRFRINAPDGSYTFYVGGTLLVGAAQAPGVYNGSFEIRITYD